MSLPAPMLTRPSDSTLQLPAACDQLFKKYFNVNGSAINVKADTLQKVSGIMDGKEFSARTFALAEKEVRRLILPCRCLE